MRPTGEMPCVVATGLRAADAPEALHLLTALLVDAGCVDPQYGNAVSDREAAFPTGLPTDPPVALPHADPDHVRRSAMAVGIFADPIAFKEMGSPDHDLNVRLVFLLAMKGKDEAVRLLKQLVLAFRDGERLRRLQDASSAQEARGQVEDLLRGIEDG
jgi:PTS system galactitol-specific IIA component